MRSRSRLVIVTLVVLGWSWIDGLTEISGLLKSKKDVLVRRIGKMDNALVCGPRKSQYVEERLVDGIR